MIHEIELDIDAGGKGFVKLNGENIECKGFSIQSQAHKPSVVTLQLFARVKGRVRVEFLTNIGSDEPVKLADNVTGTGDPYGQFATAAETGRLVNELKGEIDKLPDSVENK